METTGPADLTDTRFADTLTLAIQRRRLPLKQLVSRLAEAGTPVSMATLSYWQSGRSLPTRNRSLVAIRELEKVLNLPVAQLTSTLPDDLSSRWDLVRAANMEGRPMAILEAMGIDPVRNYTNQYLNDRLRVSADRTEHHETTRQFLRSKVDGLDRMAMVLRQNCDEDVPPLVAGGDGCTLGRVVQLDDAGLMAAELLFDRPLAKGELYAFEYTMLEQLPPDIPDAGMSRVLPETLPYMVLDVTFDGEIPPVVEYHTTPREYLGDTNPAHAQRQVLECAAVVSLTLTDASPGLHTLCWYRDASSVPGGSTSADETEADRGADDVQ